MRISFGATLVAVLVLAFQTVAIDGLCCPWTLSSNVKCQCDDGGYVHPWECCSTGTCNVFCCNCDGPCKTQGPPSPLTHLLDAISSGHRRPKRFAEAAANQMEALNGARHFDAIDLDKDFKISLDEAMVFLGMKEDFPRAKRSPDWFDSMDTDGNGFISPEEFDGSHLTEQVLRMQLRRR